MLVGIFVTVAVFAPLIAPYDPRDQGPLSGAFDGPSRDHLLGLDALARDEFSLDAEIHSDTRPLWPAVDALLDAAGNELHCMRDATRGGVASVLNELARSMGQPDFYPFVMSRPVVSKLQFVHLVVRDARGPEDAG